MDISFAKGHGTGNDFVLVDDRDANLEITASTVAALCDRHTGIGADGLIRAVPSAAIDDEHAREAVAAGAVWFMDYRNRDGSVSEMCGNGVRVFVRFLVEQGHVTLGDHEWIDVGTRAGVKRVTAIGSDFSVDMGVWSLDGGEPLVGVRDMAVPRPGLGISVGNPHVVVALADDDELATLDLTRRPVLDPEPEAGANVEFVVPEAITGELGHISMRVHERGVGETRSCGTGAVAAALATRHWAGATAPNSWIVDVPGGRLGVDVAKPDDASPEHVWLTGPAQIVYRGEVSV